MKASGSMGHMGNVSQTVTIVPRLEYSTDLLSGIIDDLKSQKKRLRASNMKLIRTSEGVDPTLYGAIDLERKVAFSLETLLRIRQMVTSISGVPGILETLPLAIPTIRTISAQLYDTALACSQKLCELSVHLGSILLDSAIIATAKFDFYRSNSESALLLDKVKLMTDSKINKQYHKLDSLKQ